MTCSVGSPSTRDWRSSSHRATTMAAAGKRPYQRMERGPTWMAMAPGEGNLSLQRDPPCGRSARMEAVRFLVGKDVHDLPRAVERLHAVPEVRVEKIAVSLQEELAELAVEPDEGQELLREHIVGPHVEPGLGRHLLLEGARLGHATEVAVREGGELIVVVEDDPAVPRHPEVLEQHVAWEDVGGGEVLDGLAEVKGGGPGRHGRRLAEEQVEGAHATLHVEVAKNHAIVGDGHGVRGLLGELGEERVADAAP